MGYEGIAVDDLGAFAELERDCIDVACDESRPSWERQHRSFVALLIGLFGDNDQYLFDAVFYARVHLTARMLGLLADPDAIKERWRELHANELCATKERECVVLPALSPPQDHRNNAE